MSLQMDMDASGVTRAPISVLPAASSDVQVQVTSATAGGGATLRPECERPRCSSTPCSPMKSPSVSGYQILHMNSNYLVGFTTGEELLKLAQHWSTGGIGSAAGFGAGVGTGGGGVGGASVERPTPEAPPATPLRRAVDAGLHRAARLYKTRSRYYQPYDIPALNGRRRRRMPSSGDSYLRPALGGGGGGPSAVCSVLGEGGKALHGPLPLCLLKSKRAQSKSLDYLNLDKMSLREPSADTEVLQYQLQHLTLRGERVYTRNKT